jgi:preprotein translocase subunit SecF
VAVIRHGTDGSVYGGIDFNGGTRIPVILEEPVDQTTMNELVQTIKKRVARNVIG